MTSPAPSITCAQVATIFAVTRYNQVAFRNELIDTYANLVKGGACKAFAIDLCDAHGKAIAVDRLHARGVHAYFVTNAGACLLASSHEILTLGPKA